MIRIAAVALVLANAIHCVAQSPFETRISVSQIEGLTAKSVIVEQWADRVLILPTERDATSQLGLRVQVQSTAKFVSVRIANSQYEHQSVTRTKSGDWLMLGAPGKYHVTVIEFDPEKGIFFSDQVAEIKVGTRPDDPRPPPASFETLQRLSRTEADKLNDPGTRKQLSIAYAGAAEKMAGLSWADCVVLVTKARFTVLLNRSATSRKVDWNAWLHSVDPELNRVVGSNPVTYAAAILAISEALK